MLKKNILFVGNIKEDGSTSMHVYLRDLLKNMEGVDFISPSTKIRPSIYKIFIYPFKIKRGYSVYHIIDHSYSFLAHLLPKRKVVITCHDIIPLKVGGSNNFLKRLLFRFYISGLKRARFIFAISKNTSKDLREKLNIPDEKIKVIPYGIDLSLFKRKNKRKLREKMNLKKKIVLLSVGGVFYKNTLLILKSLNSLKKKYPNLILIKIGRFSKEEKEYIKKNELKSSIIQKEYVDQKDLIKFYNVSDILIFPSLYEGFGRPPLEAMACGVPVITSNASSLPEVVGKAAMIINPYSQRELNKTIIDLIENKKLRKNLIEAGYENIKRFSWKKHAKELQKYYRIVLNDQ